MKLSFHYGKPQCKQKLFMMLCMNRLHQYQLKYSAVSTAAWLPQNLENLEKC